MLLSSLLREQANFHTLRDCFPSPAVQGLKQLCCVKQHRSALNLSVDLARAGSAPLLQLPQHTHTAMHPFRGPGHVKWLWKFGSGPWAVKNLHLLDSLGGLCPAGGWKKPADSLINSFFVSGKYSATSLLLFWDHSWCADYVHLSTCLGIPHVVLFPFLW